MRTQRAATAVSVPKATSAEMGSALRTSPLVWPNAMQGVMGIGQGVWDIVGDSGWSAVPSHECCPCRCPREGLL